MSNLQILSQSIRTFENLYALNDLHIASGGKSKHQPSNFVRLDTTKALIAEIEKDNQHALKIFEAATFKALTLARSLLLPMPCGSAQNST